MARLDLDKILTTDILVKYLILRMEKKYSSSVTMDNFISLLNAINKRYGVNYDFQSHIESNRIIIDLINSEYRGMIDVDTKDGKLILSANYNLTEEVYPELKLNKLDDILRNELESFMDMFASYEEDKLANGEPNYKVESLSAILTERIWMSDVKKLIKKGNWPKYCIDINKYMFAYDMHSAIKTGKSRTSYIELYKKITDMLSSMYANDKTLQISNFGEVYLSKYNFSRLSTVSRVEFSNAFSNTEVKTDLVDSRVSFKTYDPYLDGSYEESVSLNSARTSLLTTKFKERIK